MYFLFYSQFQNVFSSQTNCIFHLSDDPPARADGRVWEGFLQEELLRVRQRLWDRQRGPWFVSFFLFFVFVFVFEINKGCLCLWMSTNLGSTKVVMVYLALCILEFPKFQSLNSDCWVSLSFTISMSKYESPNSDYWVGLRTLAEKTGKHCTWELKVTIPITITITITITMVRILNCAYRLRSGMRAKRRKRGFSTFTFQNLTFCHHRSQCSSSWSWSYPLASATTASSLWALLQLISWKWTDFSRTLITQSKLLCYCCCYWLFSFYFYCGFYRPKTLCNWCWLLKRRFAGRVRCDRK